MAVYEHTYKQYLGKLTPEWSRFLVIPRHAFRDVFKSKLFTAFFVVCFIPLLVEAILIYLHHNVNALAILQVNVRELIPIDASFFQTFVNLQGSFAFFVTLLVGPPLVARDLEKQCVAALSVPAVFADRVCAGQNVGAVDSAFGDDLGAAVVVVSVSVVPRRRTLVCRQLVDRERDLHRQRGLDSAAGVAVAGDVGAGEVASGCQRRAARHVLYSVSVRRSG